MKLSKNWLNRYLKTSYSDEKLAEMLTAIGLEVEGQEFVESIKGGLIGVVVGEVLECGKHPDADKLSITKVSIGADENLPIVCGAPNVAAGQKVLVATVGTTLYPDGGSFKIKKAKIRGVESIGMICAEDELGLGNDHVGIMVLDSDAQVGMPAAELFDLSTDTVFDIGLTPNRSDATSQFGVARDLHAYIKVNLDKEITLTEPISEKFHINDTSERIDIEVEDYEKCPRYSGLILNNVKVGPSPEWMQKLLRSVDVKPINNIVDVTNFILHEMGQPLHAFDANKINDDKVIVKCVEEGTKFLTLDDREVELSSEDLMICDGDGKGMCIGGVFGGKSSGVTETTTKVFLESAYFNSSSIRRTSMRHNLRTDAAKIYEKGGDPNITVLALKRAASMICEFSGAVVSSEITDIYPKKIESVELRLRYSRVRDVIGHTIDEDTIHTILNALDIEISPLDEGSIKVKIPTNKFDVTREIDVIEEILRIYGFNEVPIPQVVKSNINYSEYPDKNQFKNKIGNGLASIGFNEMMGMSLIESKYCQDLLGIADEKLVFVNNTSNIHLDVMRPDMLISGALSIVHNMNRKQFDLKTFEFGKTYQKNGDDFEEKEFVSLFVTGKDSVQSWNSIAEEVDYYHLKKYVHFVLDMIGARGYQMRTSEDERFVYGLEYFRGPMSVVTFGQVHPKIAKDIGVKSNLFYAEFNLLNLMNMVRKQNVSVTEISKYPSVKRDLALVLDKDVSFDKVEMIARKTLKSNLVDFNLFDVYENAEQLGESKKSYAISMTLSSLENTLKDKEIEKMMQTLIKKYEGKLGALIRQ